MPLELEPLEAAVLDLLLAGEHPVLVALRAQLASATVTRRELTGVGFFVDFTIADTAPRAPARRLRFGDVHAAIDGLQHGAGFVVLVDDGVLRELEAFSYDEPWPAQVEQFSVGYVEPQRARVLAQLHDAIAAVP